jgi:hypothetical protein
VPAARQILATLALLTLPLYAHAQVSAEQFLQYVDRVCKDGPLESRSTKVELKAEAKFEISDLIKKLFGGGASIGANRTVVESSGIAQDQVATAIKNGNDCRVAMFTTFKEKIDLGQTRINPPLLGQQQPSYGTNPAKPPPASRETQGQLALSAPAIAEAGLAIGDSLTKVRKAGLPGQFETYSGNVTTFTIPIQIPVQSAYGVGLRPGEAIFYFDKSAIAMIWVEVSESFDCAQADSFRSILSSTIRDLGEPIEPPQKEVGPATFDNVAYVAERTLYKFGANGEKRAILVTNARGTPVPLLRKCVVIVTRVRSG